MEENKQQILHSDSGSLPKSECQNNQGSVKKPKKKKFRIDIRKMGVDIDRNEYQEIVLSNSNHPEIFK